MNKTILVHLPAYREPELVPTIEDAIKNAKHPDRVHFGICRQYHPDDQFDDVDQFRDREGFKVMDVHYKDAKGLPWARAQINEQLMTDEDYLLQLDSHHRFAKDWDQILIDMHDGLKADGVKKPLIGGYLPQYNPSTDPKGRADCPWQAQFACFYPFGTIFIRPGELPNWRNLKKPPRARFLSGHFCFGDSQWGRDVLHDPDIFFSGEELNLSVRSYTHGYDIFHSHKLLIWHATMREERSGMLVWDDKSKSGDHAWVKQQDDARKKIRQLLCGEDNGFEIDPKYDLGKERTVADYEKFAGLDFKNKRVKQSTHENKYPPVPEDDPWMTSFYHLVNVDRSQLPGDDYESILIAFDDKDGNGIFSKSIDGAQLTNFMNGKPIHYEEMFLHSNDKKPEKFVAWAVSKSRGWAERVETAIT